MYYNNMNIISYLVQKYRFLPNVLEICTHNIFCHLDRLDSFKQTLFICDGNTHHIISNYVIHKEMIFVICEGRALPTITNANKIETCVQQNNIKQIIGFGTGAINDLCKHVSYKAGIQYAFVPTALSMNGIVSNNASLYEDEGVKKSVTGTAPSVILLDENILLSAPKKFIGSAIMDCLAAYTACNDFIFANKINREKYPYRPYIFNIFRKQMSKILDILKRDISSIYDDYNVTLEIFELLYLSGCIMNYYGSSIAFSGGEHNIAHTMESRNSHLKTDFLHGEVISAVLPYYARLQMQHAGSKYIAQNLVNGNIANIDFTGIARDLGIPNSHKNLNIDDQEFYDCVKIAKYAKDRPTMLSVIF